jgi:hypothetical protein
MANDAARMEFRFDGQTREVGSVEEAVRIWEEYRDSTGGGFSDIGNGGRIVVAGKVSARVSYNGTVTNR